MKPLSGHFATYHRSSLFNQTTINQNEAFHYSYFHHSTLRRQCISVSVVVVANKARKAQHSFETKPFIATRLPKCIKIEMTFIIP